MHREALMKLAAKSNSVNIGVQMISSKQYEADENK